MRKLVIALTYATPLYQLAATPGTTVQYVNIDPAAL